MSSPQSNTPSKLYQVTWFNKRKGYGFVTGDIFVHHSDIQVPGYKYLKQGEYITGEVLEGAKKKLINIRAPMEGGTLMCEVDVLVHGLGRVGRSASGQEPEEDNHVGRLVSGQEQGNHVGRMVSGQEQGNHVGRMVSGQEQGSRMGRFDGSHDREIDPELDGNDVVPGIVGVRKGPLYEKVIRRPRPPTPRN